MKLHERIILKLNIFFGYIKNEKLKRTILQALPFWVASLLTGLIAVLYSKLFAGAESITGYLLVHCKWWLFLITPALFLLAFFMVRKYAPYARGSGIPQVLASLELSNPKEYPKVRKLLSIKVIVVKIISSLLAAIGGGILGREGPTIQIAGSVFRKVNQWIPDSWPRISRKNMIMTGAAAGLAAAFNTPLGGIVFAIEELTRTHISYYRVAIFTSVIIAGLTAQYFLGSYLYLGYPDVSNLSSYIFLGVILVAMITGVLGSFMCRIILAIFHWKRKFTMAQSMLFVVVCALIVVSMGLLISQETFGSGKGLITSLLFSGDKRVEWYIPILRFVGPVVTFTTGMAGGVFAPALSAGASVGAMVAGFFHLAGTNANILILAGMVGFLTGVTRTPFTAAILVLEMTDRHNVIFHLMLAGMVASMVSLLVDKHSFYDHMKLQYQDSLRKEDDEEKAKALLPAP